MFPKNHKIYGTATINAKGQIVLPVEVRKEFQVNPGDQLLVMGIDNILIGMIKIDDIDKAIEHLQSVKKMGESIPALLRPKFINDKVKGIEEHIQEIRKIQSESRE